MAEPVDIVTNHEAERARQEPGAGYNPHRPAPSDLLLPVRAQILKVPQHVERAPGAGEQAFRISVHGHTFWIQITAKVSVSIYKTNERRKGALCTSSLGLP